MPYCTHCGGEVEHVPEVAAVAETVTAEVRIAEIEAQRDIEVARINARVVRDELETAEEIAETEADAQVATAVAEAEIIGDALAEGVPGPEPDAPPPVIIADDGPDDPEPDAPPPVEPGSGEPETRTRKAAGLGFW
jgi:hypothetical protein